MTKKDVMVAEWQPIETAPKDGTKILGYSSFDGGSYQVYFYGNDFILSGFRDSYFNDFIVRVTHWMPLPQPPKEYDE